MLFSVAVILDLRQSLDMNEHEFQALIEQVQLIDAPQFEALIEAMVKIAEQANEEMPKDKMDPAWVKAAYSLQRAADALKERMGN